MCVFLLVTYILFLPLQKGNAKVNLQGKSYACGEEDTIIIPAMVE